MLINIRNADMNTDNNENWTSLSPLDKKKQLYLKQKKLLETFLEHGAISQAQFDKSLGDLTEKMEFKDGNSTNYN